MRRQSGFTLVELVMVIVLLGIVATISTQFVSLSVRGAIDLGDRQQRALQGVVISEQITREIREAHPLSVRENGNCLEWLPILGATTYETVPVEEADDDILILPFGTNARGAIDKSINDNEARLVVYGYSMSSAFYNTSGVATPISPKISGIEDNEGVTDGMVRLEAVHRFKGHSPQKRIYVVRDPVSICQNQKKLYRFEGYELRESQPSFNDLNGSASKGIMSVNLKPGSLQLKILPASLQRSAVVNFAFELAAPASNSNETTETTRVSQEVQIRNVP